MLNRLLNQLKFYLEKLFLRGTHYRLLLIAILIISFSLIAGCIVYFATPFFSWIGEAVWWAFLRLSDPGYLGDDEGLILRTVSLILIILGYVLFLGALIAIMTQWLHSTIQKLESGITPIIQNDHILILGFTNRTTTIIREILLSGGRVKRFLSYLGTKSLYIVILADEVTTDLVNNLKVELGDIWDQKKIILRSGTPLRIEHLRRVDFMNAGVIIIPGADFLSEGSDIMDSRVIKTLLSISNYGKPKKNEKFPFIVAELQDSRKISLAKNSYKGDVEIIAGDSFISRLIAQNVRHKGLSYIYSELLEYNEGNEIYIRDCPALQGNKFYSLINAFPEAVLLGVVRKDGDILKPFLNPNEDFELLKNDRLVLVARDYEDTEHLDSYIPSEIKRILRHRNKKNHLNKKLLVLGWNHKFPSLIKEFESYENESFEIDNLSMTPVNERLSYAEKYELNPQKIKLRYLHGDYTAPPGLLKLNPSGYDTIVFLGSIRFEGVEESDARTLLGYLVLRDILPKDSSKPNLVIELMDPENERLFRKQKGEVLISPVILSHMLAHVAIRKDLNVVFDELFGSSGAEIYFNSASEYGLNDREIIFSDIQKKLASHGDIALGIKLNDGSIMKNRILLNPDRKKKWFLNDKDEIVVITTTAF